MWSNSRFQDKKSDEVHIYAIFSVRGKIRLSKCSEHSERFHYDTYRPRGAHKSYFDNIYLTYSHFGQNAKTVENKTFKICGS